MKIQEIEQIEKIKILHEGKNKAGGTMTILAPFTQADQKNRNGRIYPRALLQREVDRVQGLIEKGAFIGTGDHHQTGQTTIADASHIIKKLWLDKDGRGMAELKIVPTTRGKNVMELIKQGATLGLSTRGTGDVSPTGVVQGSYKLLGIDIVTSPSASVANFNQDNVFESVGFDEQAEEKKFKTGSSEEFVQAILESCYDRDLRENFFSGSYEEWLREKEAFYRATISVQNGIYKTEAEALEAMGETEKAKKYSNKIQKVTPKQIAYEAMVAGIDPVEFCKRINEKIDHQEAMERSGYSLEERMSCYNQASKTGAFDLSNEDDCKKALEVFSPILNDSDAQLEEEAQELFEKLNEREGPKVSLRSCRNLLLKEREIKKREEIKELKIQSAIRENLIAGPKKKF
jgi:hypothetical protein